MSHADYRGHLDLKLAYGKPDGLEVATMLRKGKLGGKYSAETQVTYPLSRLLPRAASRRAPEFISLRDDIRRAGRPRVDCRDGKAFPIRRLLAASSSAASGSSPGSPSGSSSHLSAA